ncbi:MAG TPA: hypothetical protein H9890_03065 [Candidatus Faecalibacterium intestinigallinarum]|uniref:Uncharacterized protein n=1 Tax=Candidatus Faecalibacterium intestinigallinarum TaxID=2838581 RepID=A0A9D1QA05_9FIRM|nr:hypothetical protein [Candidatus Faecalibacterium intestinigallinarum]
MTREEKFNDYEGFVAKFQPKKTTDDCYTPPAVYEAVKAWACRRYGIDPSRTVRPFWPGGDYERFDYPAGAVVLDNPPFSCLARIVRFYTERQIPYFLFAPGLTALGLARHGAGVIYTDSRITYHNGAQVNTAFVTSYGDNAVEITPDLGEAIKAAQRKGYTIKRTIYQYPPNLLTTQAALALARNGIPYALPRREAVFIRALDAMRAEGKEAFGGALLISDRAAARKADAEQAVPHTDAPTRVWTLSGRERQIIEELNHKDDERPCAAP